MGCPDTPQVCCTSPRRDVSKEAHNMTRIDGWMDGWMDGRASISLEMLNKNDIPMSGEVPETEFWLSESSCNTTFLVDSK